MENVGNPPPNFLQGVTQGCHVEAGSERCGQGVGRPTPGSAAPNCLWLVGCVLGLGLVFSCLGPGLFGKWPFSISLFIQGIFLALFMYLHTCPPTNEQSPKLVEFVSYKS